MLDLQGDGGARLDAKHLYPTKPGFILAYPYYWEEFHSSALGLTGPQKSRSSAMDSGWAIPLS